MSLTKAMQYEDMPLKVAKVRYTETNINKMTTPRIIAHLVIKHKFGLLATFTTIFVAFTLFGTLIVGLAESL